MQALIQELLSPIHLLLYLFAYGLSATPTSYLVARFVHGIDIRRMTADSHTASNIYATMSRRSGVMVFIFDLLKGLLPAAIAQSLGISIEGIALTGFFSVLGHCFSFWIYFLGGHGGITLAGALAIVYWPAAIIILLANIGFFMAGMAVGRASIIGSVLGAIVLFFGIVNKAVWLIVAASVAVIIIRHRARTK